MSGETKARLTSPGGWGEVGSAEMTRYTKPATRSRSGCGLGAMYDEGNPCPNKRTHVGMANGVALCGGCEFHVGRWVRDGYPPPLPRDVWQRRYLLAERAKAERKIARIDRKLAALNSLQPEQPASEIDAHAEGRLALQNSGDRAVVAAGPRPDLTRRSSNERR